MSDQTAREVKNYLSKIQSREDIIQWVKDFQRGHDCDPECSHDLDVWLAHDQALREALAQARREEREACADIADDKVLEPDEANSWGDQMHNAACRAIAQAIRQREGT